jgi:hypothetical protein
MNQIECNMNELEKKKRFFKDAYFFTAIISIFILVAYLMGNSYIFEVMSTKLNLIPKHSGSLPSLNVGDFHSILSNQAFSSAAPSSGDIVGTLTTTS